MSFRQSPEPLREYVWVLEEFNRSKDEFLSWARLPGATEAEMAAVLGVEELEYADLYDLPASGLKKLSSRYALTTDISTHYYLVGREALR